MKPNLILHFGMPKTGNTSLVKGFLAKCPLLHYEGIHSRDRGVARSLDLIATAEEMEYVRREPEVRDYLRNAIRGDKPTVISKVDFCMGHHYPVWFGYADRQLVAQRCKAILPEATVLIVIRNQLTFLPSLFSQWLKHPYVVQQSLTTWFELQRTGITTELGSCFRIPQYDNVLNMLDGVFGAENVRVLVYEEFLREPRRFLEELCGIIGLPAESAGKYYEETWENPPASRAERLVKKFSYHYPWLVPIFPRFIRKAAKVGLKSFSRRRRSEFNAEQIAYLSQFYSAGNRRVAQRLGKDLRALGYPL